ncbi:MAG: carboxypeptidase regulatory-like domain-containing protein [Saprospirales bacterium]|nr:carboxypeptidase regulatory-like domain-containing protein [Saprospirales bacterium]
MKRFIYLLLLLHCIPGSAQYPISGFIRSRNQKPIVGAKVIETTYGQVFFTDQNGRFSGNLPEKTINVNLEISANGFLTLSKGCQTNGAGVVTEIIVLGREQALYLIFIDERGRPVQVDTFLIRGVRVNFRTDNYGNGEVPFDMTDGCSHGIVIWYYTRGFIPGSQNIMVPCDGAPVYIRLKRTPPDMHLLDMMDDFQGAFSRFMKTPYFKNVVDEDVLLQSREILKKSAAIEQLDKSDVSSPVMETCLKLFGNSQSPYRQLVYWLNTDPAIALGWAAQTQKEDLDRQIEHFRYDIEHSKITPLELPDWADKRVEALRVIYARSKQLCKNYPGLDCSTLHQEILDNLNEILKLLNDPHLKEWPEELQIEIAISIGNVQDRINTLKND